MKEYESFDEIQADYVAELKALLPYLLAWRNSLDLLRNPAENRNIWWTGVSGHPRVLAIFRKYYFAIEQMNVNLEAAYEARERKLDETMWGKEDPEAGPGTRHHIDLLINSKVLDVSGLRDVVSGLTLVPIALDQEDYPV